MPHRFAALVPLLSALTWLPAGAAGAAEAERPDGEEIARRIDARLAGRSVSRMATLEMIDPEGKVRERRLRCFWKRGEDAMDLAYYVLAPADMRHAAFLARDYYDAERDDDQWIYRPLNKRAQRVAEQRRSDAFFGSDFSLEDVKKETRVEVAEYTWKTLGEAEVEGHRTWVVEQIPATPQLAKDLGYGRIVSYVDPELWMSRRIEYWDPELEPLKVLQMGEIEAVDGVWTARRITATDHRTGHRSVLRFDEIDYATPPDDAVFSVQMAEKEPFR